MISLWQSRLTPVAGEPLDDIWRFFERARSALTDGPVIGSDIGVVEYILLACTAILIVTLLVRHFLDRSHPADLIAALRGPRLLGYAACLLFLGGFIAWSTIAIIASAAIAPGVVSPDGYRKTVQHLEGGIVREIHVREGDTVEPGQALVTLEDIQARARYQELRDRLSHLLAIEARLMAEQSHAAAVAFPEELVRLQSPRALEAIQSQDDLFHSRRDTRDGREKILGLRIKQLEEEIAGLKDLVAAQGTQLRLIGREISNVQELVDKGLERLPRLLALQRLQADITGEQALNRSKIARSKQQIGETDMQLITQRQEDKERVSDELGKVRAELAEVRSQLPSREDVLSRTVVEAPIAGTVMNLRVHTHTGVITSGQPLLDIVPAEAQPVIDARVKPTDIDVVRPGMTARILLTAYKQRTLPQIHGVLRSISADYLVDERSGESYFLAKVDVSETELARLTDITLSPGMPAEVMILTGERTFLDYLVRPLTDSVTKSFREN